MRTRNAIHLAWTGLATAAAIFFGLRSTSPPEATPAPRSDVASIPSTEPRKARSAESLEGFLALALEPPAARSDDDRPVEVRVRELFESSRKLEVLLEDMNLSDWKEKRLELDGIRRRLFSLVAYEPKAHLALMNLLSEADEEGAGDIYEFLGHPWARNTRHNDVVRDIEAKARNVIANDPSVARREAAIYILFRYGTGDRKAFEFGLERLATDPSVEIRDALLSEMTLAGRDIGLTREEAAPFVERLRTRLEEGVAWCAVALADWSTDAEDFRRIREKLATERDPRMRVSLVNAFSGDRTLVRDRTAEARAALIDVLDSPSEDPGVRSITRDFLASSFGPMDAASAEAVRRYDAGREGR